MDNYSDETPTQVFPVSPAPATRRVGRPWRIAAAAATAATLVAAGTGLGLAFAGDDNAAADGHSEMAMQSTSQHRGGGDESRVAWAQQYGKDRKAMPNLPDVASASDSQRAAATELLVRTEAATAKYSDSAVAKSAGFDVSASLARAEQRHPKLAKLLALADSGSSPKRMPMLHVPNPANRHDGRVLDPDAPEALMYAYTGNGAWRLVGVMYTASESYPGAPPDPGGPITRWHYHSAHGAVLMMHLFFVPGNDLARAYALTMEDM
jgi:hypothetical protein